VSEKMVIVALAFVLFLGGMVAPASAASVANTTQKGSLLLFPKILTEGNETIDEPLVDNIIYVGDDNCPLARSRFQPGRFEP
jgi:hypothetical protein